VPGPRLRDPRDFHQPLPRDRPGPRPRVGATVEPATRGTTYVVVGGAGESLHAFSAADSYEGSVDDVTGIAAYINEAGGKVNETVGWSRVRYTGYCILRIDSEPAPRGGTSTRVVRGLDETGTEIDRVVLARTAD
jgi:hypothetical protein